VEQDQVLQVQAIEDAVGQDDDGHGGEDPGKKEENPTYVT
jgi:hypothetical protein